MKISTTRVAFSCAASLLMCGTMAHRQARPQADRSDAQEAVISAMGLSAGALVGVDVSEIAIGSVFQITVPAGHRDEEVRVRFVPNDVRAPPRSSRTASVDMTRRVLVLPWHPAPTRRAYTLRVAR